MYQTVKLAKKSVKISNPFTRSLRVVHGTIPQALPFPAWGLDPGVNFGLTVIEGDKVFVFNGSLNQDEQPGRRGLIAYRFIQMMTQSLNYIGAKMVIEGASYGDRFGQVLLSELRTGFYLGVTTPPVLMPQVEIKAPKSIRKAVFGDGTIRAPDEFPTLNRNAADSLAMAIYAAQHLE
jgi:hypothetical protein